MLQVIAGAVASSEGEIVFRAEGKVVEPDEVFRHISIATPYQELIEEMTLLEFLDFHKKFKALLPVVRSEDIISIISLEASAHKQIRYYSSGMKQRVKLAQAIFSDTPCVLFDEPCTNLDDTGIALYHSMVDDYCRNRVVIVSSNDWQEYAFCKKTINILDYKV